MWQLFEYKLQDMLNVWSICSIRVTKFQIQMTKIKVRFALQEVSQESEGKAKNLLPKPWTYTPNSWASFCSPWTYENISYFLSKCKNTPSYKSLESETDVYSDEFSRILYLLNIQQWCDGATWLLKFQEFCELLLS